MISWPVLFNVGVTTPGLWRGGGHLVVAPGSLECIPGRLTSGVSASHSVRHQGAHVDVYVARLVPPWFNVTLPVHGAGETLVASMWIVGRRKLRRTLREAGFDVTEHVTWVDRGFGWAEMKRGNPPNS